MRCKRRKLIAVLLLGLGITGLQAQNAIPTAGGNASGSGGSASYTVGQIVYTTNANSNGSVAQGVQQPFEISEITGLEEAKGIPLQCSAFPNPTTENIILEVNNFELSTLNFQLYDIDGKLLETDKVVNNQTNIVMSNLAPAIYFLRIIDSGKTVKTFKIIKN